MSKISIVTGTLNRVDYLDRLIENTVISSENVELVLVDGGSEDGTLERIKNLNHPRIKLIEVGGRSSYPHYMNLGIKNASHELICQWNDDVLLCCDWEYVISQINDEYDAYLFNWKTGTAKDIQDENWLKCDGMRDNGWIIINNVEYSYQSSVNERYKEIVMNYGIYKKSVFKKYGLYNTLYNYYCADGEMAMRSYHSGAKFKTCFDIKVCVLPAEKRAIMLDEDVVRYINDCYHYVNGFHTHNITIKQFFDMGCGEYL